MYSKNDWRNYSNELYHYQRLGAKWGVRNGPPYPLDRDQLSAEQKRLGGVSESAKEKYGNTKSTSEILHLPKQASDDFEKMVLDRVKNSSSVNVDKWGRSKDTNVLYVTGLSGSGKSTVSTYLADDGKTDYLNLDSYLSQMSQESRNEWQDKRFNAYLDKSVPEWRDVINSKTGKLNFKTVDRIANALEEFGKEEYRNGRKVVCDGIQLYDNTLFADNKSFAGKPVLVVNTNPLASNYRGSIRDSENIIDMIDLMVTRLNYTQQSYNTMKKFKRDLGM